MQRKYFSQILFQPFLFVRENRLTVQRERYFSRFSDRVNNDKRRLISNFRGAKWWRIIFEKHLASLDENLSSLGRETALERLTIDKAENLGRLFVLVPRRARFESQFSRQIALATNFYCHRRDISAGFPRQPEKRTGREGRGDFLKRNAPSGGQVVTRRIPESLLNV